MNPQDAKVVSEFLLGNLEAEIPATLGVFRAVPGERADYRPDPISKSAMGLLRHITLEDEWFLNAVADGSLRARDLGRHQGHVQLDFGPIGPGACQTLPVGLSQAAEDAVALVTAPANWPAPIQVTAVLGPGDRSISVLACNFTGAAADPGPVSFRYLVIEFS